MQKKLFYLTFNDSPNGIYVSQVIDVIKLYQENNVQAKLLAFLPIRKFIFNRAKIKTLIKESIVLPSFPRLRNWELNKFWFYFLKIPCDSTIIARGIFATNLFLRSVKNKNQIKVIYDGRGAITAEQKEYNVYANTGLEEHINDLEKDAILKSDYRIAVSSKLIEYWEKNFNYSKGEEIIIPSTLSNSFLKLKDKSKSLSIKKNLGIIDEDIVLIYSGSQAGWQSFDSLREFINDILKKDKRVKIIFLCKPNKKINELLKIYPNRTYQIFVSHVEVPYYLDVADYGLIIRDESQTNIVASPVKCAEYLSRGLKVIISSNVGDFSNVIVKNDLGCLSENYSLFSSNYKNHQIEYVKKNLCKSSRIIIESYLNLLKK